jgi:hypothetical protein
MNRIVLTFGLIAGAVLSLMMAISMSFIDRIGTDNGEVLGYTTMVIAFVMVYFGVRSYRDNIVKGAITFGRAFKVGILITLLASACYVATWEVIYYNFMPDFGDKYAARQVEKAKASGATPQQIEEQTKQMAKFKEMYKNPAVNVAMTFIEPFPVGLLFTLLSAGILRKKEGDVVQSS